MKLETVVAGPPEIASALFHPKFLAAWMLLPFVPGDSATGIDDFGMFIAGGEL